MADPRRAGADRLAGALVLRDRRYRWLVLAQLRLLADRDDPQRRDAGLSPTVLGLPGWVPGAVFTINTVMIGFGQGLVVAA